MAKVLPMKTVTELISDAELDRQIREAEKRGVSEPAAKSALYNNGKIFVELVSGWNFAFNPNAFEEFADASEEELNEVGLWGRCTLACPPLDVHIGIGAIVLHLLGDRFIESELAYRRGSAKSEKKAKTSRENGKLGGRPKNGDWENARKILSNAPDVEPEIEDRL